MWFRVNFNTHFDLRYKQKRVNVSWCIWYKFWTKYINFYLSIFTCILGRREYVITNPNRFFSWYKRGQNPREKKLQNVPDISRHSGSENIIKDELLKLVEVSKTIKFKRSTWILKLASQSALLFPSYKVWLICTCQSIFNSFLIQYMN